MEAAPDPRRWLVLLAFCSHSFWQSFMFLDYGAAASLSKEVLHADDPEINFLYSGALAATLPTVPFAIYFMLHGHEFATGFLMSALIVVGAWTRWSSIVMESYWQSILSTMLVGVAGGVVVTSFTFVPARWFPERERALATTLAVQANYAGWATGTLIPSVLSDPPTKPSLEHVLLWQAILISATTTPLYVLANSRSPKVGLADPEAYSGELPAVGGRKALGVLDSARLMLGRPQFLVHALCYAVLGGVGFGVSGVVDEVFSSSLPRVPALACNGTQASP